MPQIICLGILVADIIGRPIERVPARGALELVESITTHIGGCAANTGIGLQKLGVETAVIGAVGRDGFGQFVRHTLESHGVDTRGVSETGAAPTSATMVLVQPDGERSFLHCVGANAAFGDDFEESILQGAQILHIAGHGLMPAFDGAPCARVLQEAQKRGIKTSLDTAGAPDDTWRHNLRCCLPFLDYFVPSLHEVRELVLGPQTPEHITKQLLGLGVGTVALKMGRDGSYAKNQRGEEARVAALKVNTVDATGAGDAFAAGFLAAALRDLPLETCLQMGNATGARCVQAVGTVEGLGEWNSTFAMTL